MSDMASSSVEHDETHHVGGTDAPVSTVSAAPFTEREIEQFDADDGDAGRALGKMLASFFLYTIIVMVGVAWWTFSRR